MSCGPPPPQALPVTPSALPRLSAALGCVLAHFPTGCLGVPLRVEGPVGLGQPGQGGSATLASIPLSSLAAETWREPPCMTPATARRGAKAGIGLCSAERPAHSAPPTSPGAPASEHTAQVPPVCPGWRWQMVLASPPPSCPGRRALQTAGICLPRTPHPAKAPGLGAGRHPEDDHRGPGRGRTCLRPPSLW